MMSESEEESSNSENNWPMNEDWMLDILKEDDKSEAKVKINVIQYFGNVLLFAMFSVNWIERDLMGKCLPFVYFTVFQCQINMPTWCEQFE